MFVAVDELSATSSWIWHLTNYSPNVQGKTKNNTRDFDFFCILLGLCRYFSDEYTLYFSTTTAVAKVPYTAPPLPSHVKFQVPENCVIIQARSESKNKQKIKCLSNLEPEGPHLFFSVHSICILSGMYFLVTHCVWPLGERHISNHVCCAIYSTTDILWK